MSRKLFAGALGALVVLVFSAAALAQPGQSFSPVKVSKASRFAQSQPLSEMRYPNLPPILRRVIGDRILSKAQIEQLRQKLIKGGQLRPQTHGIVLPLDRKEPALSVLRRVKDPALQTKMQRAVAPHQFTTPGLGFDGLGLSTDSSPGFTPPDTNAAVGQDFIVETVNVEFAVYSKTDGSLVFGPFDITNLWSELGGGCLNDGTSDPIVNYDQIAHRWVISQITVNDPTMNLHCVAISQTSDPTGAYYLYAFEITPGLPDYPKVAVWPDAYYATFNEFNPNFTGVIFAAYEREAMLAGDPNAQIITFEEANNAYSDLPVEVDGATMPPAGAPGLFVNYISPNLYGAGAPFAIEVWAMHVDWANPANSTLTDAAQLTVDPFTDLVCGGARACIPQASVTQKLDAISDRLMYRAVYRNFGDHQAIVLMHNVGADASGNPPVGERWYELRLPSGSIDPATWSVFQQGTFAPADTNSRWMGSIVFDHVGNMALGYSVSGPSQDPNISYTGRFATDPLGQMTQTETLMQAAGGADDGSGSTSGPVARWGDYTSMQIDPSDDCTFWYANQYWASPGGAFSWSTHIGSMKFTNCSIGPQGTLTGTVTATASGSAIAGATITIMPNNITTQTGDDGTYTIQLAPGSYTVTASDFGFLSESASVTINDDQTTTQDFSLSPAPMFTLSGNVTDGSGHGWGLYAEVKVSNIEGEQVADVWTNPFTGAYSVDLPAADYIVDFSAHTPGYSPKEEDVTLSGDQPLDVALMVSAACTAPGYHITGLGQDFNGPTFPPAGWQVTTAISGAEVVWKLNSTWGEDNVTGGTGTAADADSDAAGSSSGPYDTSLITPPISVTSLHGKTMLTYKANYRELNDAFDLDISTDGGTTWTSILHWTTDHGELRGLPGVDISVDLLPFLPSVGTFQLRWRFYTTDPSDTGFNWYAMVDDVKLGDCGPLPGGIVKGSVTDQASGEALIGATLTADTGQSATTFANPADPNLVNGLYILFADAGDRTLTASDGDYTPQTVSFTLANNESKQQDFALKAAKFTADPDHFTLHVKVGEQATRTMEIANVGNDTGAFTILAIDAPAPATGAAAVPVRLVPLKHPEWFNKTIFWIRKHAKPGEWPPAELGGLANFGFREGDGAWVNLANLPVKAGDNLAEFNKQTGKLYSVTGVNNSSSGFAGSFVYDPGTDTWSPIADIPTQRELPTGHFINGKLYVVGGINGSGVVGAVDVYDPATDSWDSSRAPTPTPIVAASSAVVDGKLYVIGGQGGSPLANVATVQVYDPVADSWSTASDYPHPVAFEACGTIAGKIYCAGGFSSTGDFDDGFVYDPATDTWSPIADIPISGGVGGAVYAAAGGKLILAGGFLGTNATATNQVIAYDPNTDSWSDLPNTNVPLARAGGACGFYTVGSLLSIVGQSFTFSDAVQQLPGFACTGGGGIPWLTVAPTQGTLAVGAMANVTLTFDGTDQEEFTTSEAHLKITGSPHPDVIVPLTVAWDPQPVDISISGNVTPTGLVRKGDVLTYNLVAQNSPDAGGSATQTQLTYEVPEGVNYLASSTGIVCAPPSGSASAASSDVANPNVVVGPATVVCDLGTIDPNQGKLFKIAVQTTDFAFRIRGTFSVEAREPDSDPGNNTITLTSRILGISFLRLVTSSKSVDMQEGGNGEMTVSVANNGPQAGRDVVVTMDAPAFVTMKSVEASQGSCEMQEQLVCQLGDIRVNDSAEIKLSFHGAQAGSGQLSVQTKSASKDPNKGDNSAAVDITVHAMQAPSGQGSQGGSGGGGLAFAGLAFLALIALLVTAVETRRRKRQRD